MIWYFLMGMIAGAVGMLMLARWWVEEHVTFLEEVDLSEQAEIGGGELDGTASEGTESGGEGRKTDPE